MFKRILIFLTSLSGYIAFAQDDIDAMRYSQTSAFGDARFTAMAGSFGALGANISCMNFNPAGIAMYRKGEFVLTPGIKLQSTAASHYGNNTNDFAGKFNISNIGFVTAWDSKNNYPTNSKQYANFNQRNAFGISYNRMADFNTNTTIEGFPVKSSIINDFLSVAQGVNPSQLNQSYEWLAYQTYLINPISNSDTSHYWGIIDPNTSVKQTKTIKTTGRIGELAFSFAHAFDDKFYLGATLGIPLLRFGRNSTYTETDYKSQDTIFRSLKYSEQLATTGSGYNLKVGGIYRVSENVRFGAYAHTPTVLNLSDNYKYSMDASFDQNLIPISATQYTNAATMESTGAFKYKIITPARFGASICYVYNKLFAFNIDGEYISYATAKMKDTDHYLDAVSLTIASKYKSTMNLRVGGELNIKPLVIRLGFASYGSPFGNTLSGKFVRNTVSSGIGFRGVRNTYIDFGLMYTQWKEDYFVFSYPFVNASKITNGVVYFTGTLGVKFN